MVHSTYLYLTASVSRGWALIDWASVIFGINIRHYEHKFLIYSKILGIAKKAQKDLNLLNFLLINKG